MLVVPTGAAFINNNALFTGPEEKIQIEKADSPNSEYVEINSERQLTVNITEESGNLSASGVNPNAQTDFDRLFRITNTDNDSREIWVTHSNQEAISFYVEETGEDLANNVTLESNESIVVSMRIDTTDGDTPIGAVLTTDLYIGDREPEPEAVIIGPDSVEEGDTVDLSGEESTGVDLNYSWTITNGDGELIDAGTVSPTYQAPSNLTEDQLVTVELTVTDGGGRTAIATKTIEVIGNVPPTADAGGPYRVEAGETVRLDGRDSSDPDGSIGNYAWSIDSDIGTLSNTGSARPRFTAPSDLTENTTVSVELTVTDNDSITDTTTQTIRIIANQPPTIDAGGPYRTGSNKTIPLDDAAATDPDGSIEAYNWTIVSGGGSLSDTGNLTAQYTAPTVSDGNQTVEVRLTVTDDDGVTANATTTITVTPNAPPVVELGGPYTVAPNESVEIADTAFSDADGTITERSWSIIDGPGSLSDTDADTPIYTAPADITENTTVTVEVTVVDDSGATTTETTNITVVTVNQPPRVIPGGPYMVQTGNELAIDEINATDPDGTITGYNWEIVSGEGSLTNTDSATPTYIAPDALTSNATVLANVTVTDNDGATTTRTIEIGVFRPGTDPNIRVSESTIDFGEIGKGLTVSGSVTIENNGTAPLIINQTTIVGAGTDQFRILTELPEKRILGVGQSQTIEVEFAPDEAGGFDPTLQFLSNDPDEPVTEVELQATALPPLIDVGEDRLDFGNVSVGGRETLTLTVSNPADSPADLTVRTTTIVGKNPEVFEVIGGGAPFTLAPGEEREIQIEYTPQTAGIKTAQLRIRSNAENSQIDVWLSNSDWWVRVDDMSGMSSGQTGGNESGDGGDTPSNGATSQANGARVSGNNVPAGVGITVNTSVPSVEDEQAFVQEATVVPNTKAGERATFNVLFMHDEDDPPTVNGERFNATPNRTTLEYISVEHDIPNEQLSNNSFTIRVDRDDLAADTAPEEINIRHRIGPNEWEDMDATLVEERGKTLIYRVETPGFSQFVVTGPNEEPTADAGSDTTVPAGGTVDLDAGGSTDPDGSIAEYQWAVVDGPGSLFRDSTVAPSYAIPETAQPGQTVTVRLTVTDNSGATATDTITIDITSPTTPPGNGTTPENGTGGGGLPGGASGGGNNVTPSTPTRTPTGSDTGTPGTTPTGGSGPAITEDGVGIRFSDNGQQSDAESLSDVISITDIGVPEDSEDDEERDGPNAAIRADASDGSPTQTVATNESGVSLAVASEDTTREDLDLKGADALTLVERPIPLEGTHSLFSSKDSIADDLRMVRQVEITVPQEYENRSAVLTMTVPKSRFGESDPEEAVIARQNDGWQPLATEVIDQSGDTVILQAETPGFSRFAVFAQNDVSYSWEVETYDEPLTGPSIEPTFDDPGFYNVTLTVTDSFGRTDTANYTILANDVPEVEIQWGTNTVPTNETIVMDATVQNEVGNVTYTWQFPDGTEKTGKQVNHTLPPNASGEIVVIAEDEFGAQGRDAIAVGSGDATYSVDVLSYSLQIDQNLLWFLIVLLGLLGLIALLRRFGSGAIPIGIADHPPEIEVFDDPTIDYQEQWAVIPTLRVTDQGEDLATIEVTVLSDIDGSGYETPVAHEEGILEGESEYEGTNVVVSADSGTPFETEQAYAVRITVTDEAGGETIEERPVTAEDEFVFVGETSGPDLHPSLLDGEREPGDD